jgi:hypothetical protein
VKGHAAVMAENKEFAAFCKRFGDEAGESVLERICEAHWSGSGPGVRLTDIHQHNACNHTLSGTVEHRGEAFGFVIESGDRNGTVILQWGDPEDIEAFKPEKPTLYTFVPQDDFLKERRPEMYRVYLAWTKEDWFNEKARNYNYDRHFSAGLCDREILSRLGVHSWHEASTGGETVSLRDKLSGLVGGHDDYVKDDGPPKGEVEQPPCPHCDGTGKWPMFRIDCLGCNGTGVIDAEASIDYQHPDALPTVDAAEDAGLSAVRKLKGEAG